MLSSKTKTFFIEISEYSLLTAVASAAEPPLTIESIDERPAGADADAIRDFIASQVEVKARGYAQARCAIYPESRFFRRATVEQLGRARQPNFLPEFIRSEMKVDVSANTVRLLKPGDGSEFDVAALSPQNRDIFACGALESELSEIQQNILDYRIYPTRLEIGTVSSVGALMSYLRVKDIKAPVLMLELSPDSSSIFILSGQSMDICRSLDYGLNVMFPVIQQELGLKSEEAARKLFNSNTFDFTEMGPTLLRKMVKDLQASAGFYEVQTGQTIGHLFLTLLPRNLNWIHTALSRALGLEVLHLDYNGWLRPMGIEPSEDVQLESLDSRWIGLFSIMGLYGRASKTDNAKATKQ